VDLLVVFVGVWLSLLAENWRQAAADSRFERASFGRIAQDLLSDSSDLAVNLERAMDGVTAGKWVLAHATATSIPEDSLARALTGIQFCSVFVENAGEYQALRNSGSLGIIADADLRRSIVALYEFRNFINSLHADDCDNNEHVFALMAPHVEVQAVTTRSALAERYKDGFQDNARPRVTSIPGRRALLGSAEFRTRVAALVGHRAFLANVLEGHASALGDLREDLLSRTRE
jgi:hypothetical protein